MKLPTTATELVDIAVVVGDIYMAAAVFGIANDTQQQTLEELMFAKRRNRLSLASWEHTPTAVLKALSNSNDVAVQLRLVNRNKQAHHANDTANELTLVKQAKDSKLSLSGLKILSASPNAAVRARVVANSAFPASCLADFVTERSATVRRALATRADISIELMQQLSIDTDSWVRQRLGRNPSLSVALMRQLATDDIDEVRRAVTRNKNCPMSLLEQLAKDSCAWVRAGVAFQANASSDLMCSLFKAADSDTDIDVLSGVASNPNTPISILLSLTQHEDADVRRGVILNPKVGRAVLLPLLQDPYYLHRLLLVGSQKLSKTDKWSLHDDLDYRVRFLVFKWFADGLLPQLINDESN